MFSFCERQAKEYRSCLNDLINLEFFPPASGLRFQRLIGPFFSWWEIGFPDVFWEIFWVMESSLCSFRILLCRLFQLWNYKWHWIVRNLNEVRPCRRTKKPWTSLCQLWPTHWPHSTRYPAIDVGHMAMSEKSMIRGPALLFL